MAQWNMTISREFLSDLQRIPNPITIKTLNTIDRMCMNPWKKELHPEKVKQAEPGIHSCRVDDKYRVIWKYIKPIEIVFCVVDKHDEAYRRAVRKSFMLEDGIIKVANILKEGARKAEAGEGSLFGWGRSEEQKYGKLFLGYSDSELIQFGIPEDILPNLRAVDNLNQLENVERLLPVEVFDKLLEIAIGDINRSVVQDEKLNKSLQEYQGGDDLHRLVDSEEFKRVLAGDMEDWMLFLAPTQKHLVFRDYQGPARVKGVAGSGKTVVAIHRVRQLAKNAHEQNQKILFLTYGNRLPGIIQYLLKKLTGEDAPELEAVECLTINQWCARFLRKNGMNLNVNHSTQEEALSEAISKETPNFSTPSLWKRSQSFSTDEIRYVIKGRDVQTLEEYLSLDRSGRGTPLQEHERRALYAVCKTYQTELDKKNICDFDDFILRSLRLVEKGELNSKYYGAVVDEIQDLTEATMKLIRAIVPNKTNDLFLVGDGLQRIYAGGYSLGRLGIEVVGRGNLLRKNYRNTQEVLQAAHAMMSDCSFDDMDDEESDVIEPEYSVRHGEIPELRKFQDPEQELDWIGKKISSIIKSSGYKEKDFALFYRHRKPYKSLIKRLLGDKFQVIELSKEPETFFGDGVKYTTFHSAKGIEFKVVFVLGVTDGQFVPRDDWTLEDKALEEYLAREQRLLYVAMSRARDLLYLTYSRGQYSRFLNSVPDKYLILSQLGSDG